MDPLQKPLLFIVRLMSILAALMASHTHAANGKVRERINTLEELQNEIRRLHESSANTALGIALIDRGELVWLDAEGMANVKQKVLATPDSLFRIGSTSKMFTALAVLKLVDEGRLNLNTPLRELVPEVEFQNPWEDEHPVRLLHLLEHTSGWHDTSLAEYAHNDPTPAQLRDVIHLFPHKRQSRWVPGTRHAYCNTGTGIASYVVEKITGVPFEDYIQQEFFAPLGMASATFFLPDAGNVLAQPYAKGKPEEYWHIIYRAAGAVNASPRDLANLLQFYLNRGENEAGRLLLAPSAIRRMETPHSTLASKQGVTAGYGLANYTSGHKRYNVAFHGHNGGMAGAMSDFSYSPVLQGGYALVITGADSGAMQPMIDAIRDYLLRERDQPELEPQPLPERFRALDGIYRPINPRQDFSSVLPLALQAMTFRSTKTYLHRMPLLGGWDTPSADYTVDGRLLIDQWQGLPAVAIVRDPLAGEAVQVDSLLYQSVSGLWVWSQLLILGGTLLLSGLALLYGLVWFPLTLIRKRISIAESRIQAMPLLASVLLVAIVLVASLGTSDFDAFKPWSLFSISMFGLTLTYGLMAVWNLVLLYRLWNTAVRRCIYTIWAAMILLHAAVAAHLASHGMIGAQIWTW